jgi:non-specific serine/threonine protein kinase
VWLVELAELRDPELLAVTLAETLGVRDQSVRWGLRSLSAYLADKQVLLVIDNCEQLIGATAELAETLLRSCPGLRILATSRQPLGITGESTLAVPPLAVPDPDRVCSPAGLAQYEAANLLVERAAAVLPGFTVDEENCATIARLCQSLDGIPLAIELAAVRLRALSLEQIVTRLSDRYRLLTTGSRNAPARQQTLRGLIDWSYDLCSEPERILWARLSVFSGGLELDAAEAVCGDDTIPPEGILDLIASLVDKSILMRGEDSSGVRYRLLETIREYGDEKLRESGEHAALQRRHSDWYAGLAARGDAQWVGPNQANFVRRLRHEHGNLRVALEFAVTDDGPPETALRFAADLENYWFVRGFLAEGRHWLDRALSRPGTPHWTRAKALRVNAWLAVLQGDQERAAELLGEARQLATSLPDPVELAYVAQICGNMALFAGQLQEAIRLFSEALAGFRSVGAHGGEMWALIVLGLTRGLAGKPNEGFYELEECVAAAGASGDVWWRSTALWALSVLHWRDDDIARAAARAKESLELKRGLGNERFGIGLCLEVLAWIAAAERRDDRAARLFGASQRAWHAMRASFGVFGGLRAFHDACEAQLRGRLGEPAFKAAVSAGAQWSTSEALEFALEEQPRSAPAAAAVAAGAAPLTKREQQIAQLIAEGMSNREIAAKLVIAQRTAEGHVEHILSKLGFSSRAQVAAWVADQRGQHEVPPT